MYTRNLNIKKVKFKTLKQLGKDFNGADNILSIIK